MTLNRNEAIMQAIEEMQAEFLPGDEAWLIVCAGPPDCLLLGDDAHEAGRNGCVKCTRLLIGEELGRA